MVEVGRDRSQRRAKTTCIASRVRAKTTKSAIDLMQASVAMDDEPTEGSSELQAFRIKTSRIEYHLKPQDEVGGNAEDWVEEITEVMLAAEEGDDDDADRDYGAFMGDYNEVVPANEASRRPP